MNILTKFFSKSNIPKGEAKLSVHLPTQPAILESKPRIGEVRRVARNIFGRICHPESLLVTDWLRKRVSELSEDEQLLLKEEVRKMKSGVFFPWLDEFNRLNPRSALVHREKDDRWSISNLDLSKEKAGETHKITSIAAEKFSRIEKVHSAFWPDETFGKNRHEILLKIQVCSKLIREK